MVHASYPNIAPLSNYPTQNSMSDLLSNKAEVGPVAHLHTINIGSLYEGDKEEAAKLFQAARENGVFYLNLQDPRFVRIVNTVDDIFALSKDLFTLSEEEKMKFDVDKLGRLKLDG